MQNRQAGAGGGRTEEKDYSDPSNFVEYVTEHYLRERSEIPESDSQINSKYIHLVRRLVQRAEVYYKWAAEAKSNTDEVILIKAIVELEKQKRVAHMTTKSIPRARVLPAGLSEAAYDEYHETLMYDYLTSRAGGSNAESKAEVADATSPAPVVASEATASVVVAETTVPVVVAVANDSVSSGHQAQDTPSTPLALSNVDTPHNLFMSTRLLDINARVVAATTDSATPTVSASPIAVAS